MPASVIGVILEEGATAGAAVEQGNAGARERFGEPARPASDRAAVPHRGKQRVIGLAREGVRLVDVPPRVAAFVMRTRVERDLRPDLIEMQAEGLVSDPGRRKSNQFGAKVVGLTERKHAVEVLVSSRFDFAGQDGAHAGQEVPPALWKAVPSAPFVGALASHVGEASLEQDQLVGGHVVGPIEAWK